MMDNEHNAHMQVDPSTYLVSAIQAFKVDPSTEWVIESAPGFVAIKHKMGCPICNALASHCMATKRSYKIRLDEKEVSRTVAEAWPELVRYQDDYYCLLEDHNILKETAHSTEKKAEDHRVKIHELYEKLDTHRATIKNLDDQVHSLEAELQAIKGNSDELPNHEDLILENKHLQQELDYYASLTRTTLRFVPEAGIPAIGGSRLPHTHKRIIADPPTSITGVLPKPLGKSQAECWDQPALRGMSDWVMESDIHDPEMRKLYIEGRALQPHLQSSDHTAVIFRIDEYAKSLPGLPQNLVVHHDDPDWMINVIQAFNANPSGIPQNLRLEGLHVNVDDANVWYLSGDAPRFPPGISPGIFPCGTTPR
ncbi:hypothetical protein M422DRAFT_256011, partial [Sphaerobolus stellatus SS14]